MGEFAKVGSPSSINREQFEHWPDLPYFSPAANKMSTWAESGRQLADQYHQCQETLPASGQNE
jgi:hypothetical protein